MRNTARGGGGELRGRCMQHARQVCSRADRFLPGLDRVCAAVWRLDVVPTAACPVATAPPQPSATRLAAAALPQVKRRTMTSTKGHRFAKSEGFAHSDIMAEKMHDKNQFKGVEEEGEGDDENSAAGTGPRVSATESSVNASPVKKVVLEDASAGRDMSEAVVDTVQLTTLEENELVGEVSIPQGSGRGAAAVHFKHPSPANLPPPSPCRWPSWRARRWGSGSWRVARGAPCA